MESYAYSFNPRANSRLSDVRFSLKRRASHLREGSPVAAYYVTSISHFERANIRAIDRRATTLLWRSRYNVAARNYNPRRTRRNERARSFVRSLACTPATTTTTTTTILLLSRNWISAEIQVIDVIVYFARSLARSLARARAREFAFRALLMSGAT